MKNKLQQLKIFFKSQQWKKNPKNQETKLNLKKFDTNIQHEKSCQFINVSNNEYLMFPTVFKSICVAMDTFFPSIQVCSK